MKEKEALVDEGSTARHKNPLSLNKKFHTPVPKNDVYYNIDQSGAVEVAEKAVDIVEKAADIVARRVKLVANSFVGEMMAGFQSRSGKKEVTQEKKRNLPTT